MATETQETANRLNDTHIGWVNRRDAAEKLGNDAVEAIQALTKHAQDTDTDVRGAVADALGKMKSVLGGVETPVLGTAGPPSLEKLVSALEKSGKRKVSEIDGGYEVMATIANGRTQRIRITTDTSRLGKEVVRVYSPCGEATDDVYRWCLKSNLQFTHCALAIEKMDGKDMLVLVNCFLKEEITYNALKASVKEVAYYGDWVEEKLTGEDVH